MEKCWRISEVWQCGALSAALRELLYYRPLWIPDTLPNADVTPIGGTVLLLDETPELEETLAARGIATVRVMPGSSLRAEREPHQNSAGERGGLCTAGPGNRFCRSDSSVVTAGSYAGRSF